MRAASVCSVVREQVQQESDYRRISVTEVVPNEELRALLLRLYAIWESRDSDGLADLFSREPSLMITSNDPAERLTGTDAVNVFSEQMRLVPHWSVKPSDPRAYSCGNVGWISDDPMISFTNMPEYRGRLTLVLVIEQGHWRIIHWHMSVPRADPDVHLPMSVDQIEHFVRADRPQLPYSAAPDGTVTVVFTDVESSATLMERLGEPEFMRMLAWHDGIVRDSVAEHRGFIVKSQGDGFMLAFPSAASALRSCLVIRDRVRSGYRDTPIRVRAGLHCGEALRHDDDFYGRSVVIAARISALALGDEVLASDLVHGLAQGLGTFSFGERRSVTLRGLEGAFDIYPVLA
jgi:class 3 adenylate cyclase